MPQLRQPTAHQTPAREPASLQQAPAAERVSSGHPLDARARLLRLQRTVGNRAVGRLLARDGAPQQSPPAALPPVQRLVGFEVELSVPTYQVGPSLNLGKPGGRTANRRISDLLTGGLDYATDIGSLTTTHPSADTIDLKTDHDRLEDDSAHLYNVLNAKPAPAPEKFLVPDGKGVLLSNLEYSTAALDELAPGSNPRFKAMATAIDNHITKIMDGKPRSNVFTIQGTNIRTGIPISDFKEWLIGPQTAKGFPEDVKAALQTLQTHTERYISPQATAGILPGGLESAFETQYYNTLTGPQGTWPTAQRDAAKAIVDGIQGLRKDGAVGARIERWLKPAKPVDKRAFYGALAVALSYAIGQAINSTTLLDGSTYKNAVPLLVKVEDVGALAKDATTDWLRANHPPVELILDIAEWFIREVPQTKVAHWKGGTYNAQDSNKRDPVYPIDADPVRALVPVLGQVLLGIGPLETVGPGTPLEDVDPVSTAIGGSAGVGGQKGLPLEYRWITPRTAEPGELWTLFKSVLAEVRSANTQGLSEQKVGALVKSWGSFD